MQASTMESVISLFTPRLSRSDGYILIPATTQYLKEQSVANKVKATSTTMLTNVPPPNTQKVWVYISQGLFTLLYVSLDLGMTTKATDQNKQTRKEKITLNSTHFLEFKAGYVFNR